DVPLRRNRRQYEQLTDFDRAYNDLKKQVSRIDVSAATSVRRYSSCSVLATVDHQKVECTVAEGQDVRNTNDREDRAIRRVATSAPNVASIDSTPPLTSFQTSSAIKRKP
ncbi:hypothetical protein TNCV_203081, partial [Trichonephila clavipes]